MAPTIARGRTAIPTCASFVRRGQEIQAARDKYVESSASIIPPTSFIEDRGSRHDSHSTVMGVLSAQLGLAKDSIRHAITTTEAALTTNKAALQAINNIEGQLMHTTTNY
ncbi:unnamed protein product [Vitrella brassicaformis CCMP3155]|uniref:Uncharacterized protein n=1 Tax=Vitrella brassicaformis (strain CCMP3155) TaxID=1169540 RepID=A0A0G4FFJ8_VITBC|nr:unnamed protein product [Vitrella brassicaformis CCMP3155]|eukprot:CEM11972.1 unnamed protein product [Vitrella brassicaformis CCMP3155]